MTFIKKDLPYLVFPVKNICKSFISSNVCGFSNWLFKKLFANHEQYQTVDAASDKVSVHLN